MVAEHLLRGFNQNANVRWMKQALGCSRSKSAGHSRIARRRHEPTTFRIERCRRDFVGAAVARSRCAGRRLHDFLRASTSSQGYHKIAAIMRHDDILRAAELEYLQHNPPRPRAGRNAIESMGSANYWIAIFGEPVPGKPWAWLLTGHHLGATFTSAGGRVTAAPLFLGAQPLENLTGPYAGFAVLSHEGLRGLNLVSSLHPQQAKVAVLSTEPLFSDVLTGVGRRNSLSRFEGLPASDLDAPQKKLLFALVEEYVRNADFDAAERHL